MHIFKQNWGNMNKVGVEEGGRRCRGNDDDWWQKKVECIAFIFGHNQLTGVVMNELQIQRSRQMVKTVGFEVGL